MSATYAHATDIEHAGSSMGERRGNLWFRVERPGGGPAWWFAPLEDLARAAALAAELNALDPKIAWKRFQAIRLETLARRR